MTHDEIFTFKNEKIKPIEQRFIFACAGLAHSHIYGMTDSLIAAGAELKWVFDTDKNAINQFKSKYPQVKTALSLDDILCDSEVNLIVSADIPSKRAELAIKSMRSGHNFFVDKAPALTLDECKAVKRTQIETGMKYFVYYSELITNPAAIFAKQLVGRGVIGKIFHIDIFAPHRLNPETRPQWFWRRKDTGGILTDIGSHQIEQFLEFCGCPEANITNARVKNYFHPQYPEFDDFGDIILESKNGVTGYLRVDWLSPSGIKTFGDLRMTIEGEKGFIELRKNCDLGNSQNTNNVIVALDDGVFAESVSDKVTITYFNRLINDCLTGSCTAMSMDFIYSAMELTVKAQETALNYYKQEK